MTTDLRSHMSALGNGAVITYIGQEGDRWHCELRLPESRYTTTLVTAHGATPDEAVAATVQRALGFARTEGEVAA